MQREEDAGGWIGQGMERERSEAYAGARDSRGERE